MVLTFARLLGQMCGVFEQVCDIVESAEKSAKLVEWKSNKFKFDQTFARLPYVCRNCLNTLSNFCPIFVRHWSNK